MSSFSYRLKSTLKRSRLLVRFVQRWRYWRSLRQLVGPRLMRRFARLYPEAYFIQIGANDGEQLDHLQSSILTRNWRGIMVEPVPYVFARLKGNYGHLQDRVALKNLAIAGHDGSLPFWHLRQATAEDNLPRWYDALGSFRKEVLLKHVSFIPDIEQRLVCTEVPTQKFETLCRQNRVDKIDLIQMDTEGYDFEIIKLIDFDRYRPLLLIYEHHHFDAETRRACEAHLSAQGYLLRSEGMDTWGVDMRAQDSRGRHLLAYWRKLLVHYPSNASKLG
jgi:FkbM family methyltransferase